MAATAQFPFAALVGQEDLKLALSLAVVDPTIGGVLVTGHRGTAKSTAVRALADLLPPMEAIEGCPYHCDPRTPASACPHCAGSGTARTAAGRAHRGRTAARRTVIRRPVPVIDLPLGATEDRVVGSIDLERALVDGVQAFAPGLLAAAHRGFLYIDEVNLLEDHLVDVLLDVAASGVNVVEREGLSIRHPARFVLVGSGNPEEGDLRPQLLDRFGLHARIRTLHDIEQRIEIVRRRLAFEDDPQAFVKRHARAQSALRARLAAAIARRPEVTLTDGALTLAASLCDRLAIDGHRGELALSRAAVALAAYEDAQSATREHVAKVAPLALAHRLRKDPLEPAADDERVKRILAEALA